MKLFKDRRDAGRQLAEKLLHYAHDPSVIVLGLPRGGVIVAFEVAQRISAELDVFIVRKLGVPGHEELAMGAIASGGIQVLNDAIIQSFQLPDSIVDSVIKEEMKELERRERLYRGRKPKLDLRRRTAILVDDGLATGSTMLAAVLALRRQGPARIAVGVPVAAEETCREFQDQVDEIICHYTPQAFYGVGMWYERFEQTTDEEVQTLLGEAAKTENNHKHKRQRAA